MSRNQEGDNLAHKILAQKARISWVRPYQVATNWWACPNRSWPTSSARCPPQRSGNSIARCASRWRSLT